MSNHLIQCTSSFWSHLGVRDHRPYVWIFNPLSLLHRHQTNKPILGSIGKHSGSATLHLVPVNCCCLFPSKPRWSCRLPSNASNQMVGWCWIPWYCFLHTVILLKKNAGWLSQSIPTQRKNCKPLELKTPPLQAPHPIAWFLWAPFNKPELAILYSQDNPSFYNHAVNDTALPPFWATIPSNAQSAHVCQSRHQHSVLLLPPGWQPSESCWVGSSQHWQNLPGIHTHCKYHHLWPLLWHQILTQRPHSHLSKITIWVCVVLLFVGWDHIQTLTPIQCVLYGCRIAGIDLCACIWTRLWTLSPHLVMQLLNLSTKSVHRASIGVHLPGNKRWANT